jgi:hypothetical protein
MPELKFDKDKCAKCKSVNCLTMCQYMKLDKEQAKMEWQKIIKGKYSFVLESCATCYACEEYCPQGNHPFYLLVERQEQMDKLASPRALIKQWVNMTEFSGKFMVGQVKERAISFCFIPRLQQIANGKLFEDVASSWVMGAEFFCNAVFLHFSRMSVIQNRLPKVIDNISKQGIKELICLHDECWATYNSIAPAYGIEVPFKTTHYFEYLHNELVKNKRSIKLLNLKVAYQRNCSTRLIPQVDHWVDDIFKLIGVTRLEREYDKKNALCCGALMFSSKGYDLGTDLQKRNIDDMVKSGAEYCVFNCPACWDPLAEKVAKRGVKPIHMIDLCKMAIGEKPALEVKI